jgi:hypothetical protein
MTPTVEGACHCGDAHWMLRGDPGSATACNCTLCRRYGALWAYDYEGERISISGPSTSYTRVGKADPKLEILFVQNAAACFVGADLSSTQMGAAASPSIFGLHHLKRSRPFQ